MNRARLTDPDRVVYPPQGATKRDLARYLAAVAPWMLPHLAGRPAALLRCAERPGGPCVLEKHPTGPGHQALRRARIIEKGRPAEVVLVETLAALIGLLEIGALEIHTWGATASAPDQPDRLVFELDPGPTAPWERVVQGALLVRSRLLQARLESFVKTTGGEGLHVIAPIAPGPSWGECARFARAVADAIVAERPALFTASAAKGRRQGKVLIDPLRNVRGGTTVAAYSPRALPGATVSAPIGWDELEIDTRPSIYTIRTVPALLRTPAGDPWWRYGRVRQALPRDARRAPAA